MQLTDHKDFTLLFEGSYYILFKFEDNSEMEVFTTLDVNKLPDGILPQKLYDLNKKRYVDVLATSTDIVISKDSNLGSEVSKFANQFI